jgi:hypothetical protein
MPEKRQFGNRRQAAAREEAKEDRWCVAAELPRDDREGVPKIGQDTSRGSRDPDE